MLACAFQQLPFLSIQKPGLTYVREDHAVVQTVKRRKKATINEQIGNEVAEVSLSEKHIISDSSLIHFGSGEKPVSKELWVAMFRAHEAHSV